MIRRLAVLILLAGLCCLPAQPGEAAARDATDTPPPGTTIHVVQAGETLFSIAQQNDTTVEAIAQINAISNVTVIKVGQRLIVPVGNQATPTSPMGYTMGIDDTLDSLAWRYGTSVVTIAERNHIVSLDAVYAGLVLDLPPAGDPNPGISNGWIIHAGQNDTLYRIAARYHVSVALLEKANPQPHGSVLIPPVLIPGEPVVIPGDASAPPLVDTPFAQVDALPFPPQQGRTVIFHISTPDSTALTGTFMGKPLAVFDDDGGKSHAFLFGIDAFATPGSYPLELTVAGSNGSTTHFSRKLYVTSGGYNSEAITLPKDELDLLDPTVTQPELDRVLAVAAKITPQRYFNGLLSLPVRAAVTSPFGTRRSYNGGPYNQFHTGTDFGASPGTPIRAPAAGTVVLAEMLHVRGNATIIDHGWGVYTGYWHQSAIKVQVGQHVDAGQVIGLVGATGRATGPHLHWEMLVDGVQVDPMQWVRQAFP
ncbi:MAG TPA: peptidoglycan DD-metalloendopeptidase family protein [Aggregatilineaceae bacterium]|nr:peptidoglycan DD-metalloendopeptidase family protein [Aggregatilineaceae bacterium]